MSGHLESRDIHVPIRRVQERLWRVDAIGVLIRWHGVIKRRVYKVRGANALWHMDGNEKLRPWGFYVHGCVDGHSRLIIYLACCNNKRSKTVEALFMHAVSIYGWPSRMRGDWGKENNGVERRMIVKWGELHRAYLRGRTFGWSEIGETYAKIPLNSFGKSSRISSKSTCSTWRIPFISREKAINRGYWTGDPGDDLATASDPDYGHDPQAPLPPMDELQMDPTAADFSEYPDVAPERDAGIVINDDDEVQECKEILAGLDCLSDDGNWGIDHYCRAVMCVTQHVMEA
ncbi:hypothetical protein R3P38DRAFT_2800929 [Favolaschia claudopus]|uniref:Integrase core domain-containing protein n=1 Tax=Favolaschia claudopus TaxID=2862362 RepID=A0AAV9ZWJ3_9AGAR